MFRTTSVLSSFPASAVLVCHRSGKRVTCGELADMVADRASGLARRGLRRGDRVVIGEADGLDYLMGVFACWTSGYCAVAVNPALRREEQSRVLNSTGASAWLGAHGPDMPVRGRPPDNSPSPLSPDDPALILMTSGTTGIPKGVTHSLRTLAARIDLNRRYIGDHTLRRSLCILPVFFGHGFIGNCLTPLAAGSTLTLWQTPTLGELEGFGRVLDALRITFFSSVPTFWRIAPRVSQSPQTAPERVHVGSAPLSVELWETIVKWCGTGNVHNMYGMTEAANWIGGSSLSEAKGRSGHVGQPWGGEYAVLADGDVQDQGSGEVLVSSPSMMLGFWAQPGKTSKAFEGRWLRTGDIGTLGPDGALTLKGRCKSEINRGGLKILAEEIDMLLERHPDIEEACAFGIEDPVSGEAVAAAVVLCPGASFDRAGLRNWCAEQVRAEAVPQQFFPVTEIPRNDRGKIVRAQVRARVLGNEPE